MLTLHFPSPNDLGWNGYFAEAFAPYAADHFPARVSRVDRGGADLLGPAGPVHATLGRALPVVVGDWAAVRHWPDGRTTIEAVLDRRTCVVRDSAGTTSATQPLAANVDLVVVVEYLDPQPSPRRVERLLVLAWRSGAQPLVVLTKADLVSDPAGVGAEVAAATPGVDVLTVDSISGAGIDALRSRLAPGRTVVLLGPSGAGKSTLVNALAGTPLMATGVTRDDGKGRHTTTHRELLVLPGLGVIVDSPGLRSVGLVADDHAVAAAFPDIERLAERCRFRDCAHDREPGCAVLAAVVDGELDSRRLTSWRKLGREAAFQARRADARLRAQELAVWKRRSIELRQRSKLDPSLGPRPH